MCVACLIGSGTPLLPTSGQDKATTGQAVPASMSGNQASTAGAETQTTSSGLFGPITNVLWRRTLVLAFAFCIGMLGAAAFHFGVFIGFIARDSRGNLLEFLHAELLTRRLVSPSELWYFRFRSVAFWTFGGVVAAVFQMADADSLVPIQAFVLGASWPSVVTQLMSGRSNPPAQPANIAPPPQPPGAGAGGAAGGPAAGAQSVEVIT
jgi:hypothetical protein